MKKRLTIMAGALAALAIISSEELIDKVKFSFGDGE